MAASPAKTSNQQTLFATADDATAIFVRRMGEPSRQWRYHNAAGEVVGIVNRWNQPGGKKDIRPVSRNGKGWLTTGMASPRPLFDCHKIADQELVVVVEGEPAVDAAQSLGLFATTSAHGSNSPDKTDWSPLAGKQVVICPDNDQPGEKYAAKVCELLATLSPMPIVKIVRLPGIPASGDMVEWAEDGNGKDEFDALVNACEHVSLSPATAKKESTGKRPERPFVPFPVEALPGALADYIRESARSIDIDESFVAVPMLAVLAGVVGNARRIQLKRGWAEPCVIWAATIGVSGEGKSPGYDASLRPVQEQQSEWIRDYKQALAEYEQQRQMYEADVATWKRAGRKNGEPPPEEPERPSAKRITVSDSTIEALASLLSENPNGLLLSRDELSGWLGSFDSYRAGKGGDVAHWLSMHGARPMLVDRKTGQRLIAIDRAAVSVAGTIQPSALARSIIGEGKGQHLGNGLIARCLFAMPPRRPRQWSDHEVSEFTLSSYSRIVAALFQLVGEADENDHLKPIDVPLSPAAREVFRRFSNRHGMEQAQLGEHLSSAWSKLQGYAARLALLIHLIRETDRAFDEPEPVSADAMRSGIVLAQWFAEEAARVYRLFGADGDTAEAKQSRDDDRLLEWIAGHGRTATSRDITRGVRRFRSDAKAAEAALESLAKAGKLTREVVPPGPKGGRETTKYRISSHGSVDGTTTHEHQQNSEVVSTNGVDGVGLCRQSTVHDDDEKCRHNLAINTGNGDTTHEKDGATEVVVPSTPPREKNLAPCAPVSPGERDRGSI